MSDPSAASGPCRPWGPAASLAWGVFAIAAWLGAQYLLADYLIEPFSAGISDAALLAHDGAFVATITIGAALVPLAVIAIAARSANCRVVDYLGLYRPPARYVAIGLAVLAVLIPLVDLFSYLAGQAVTPRFVIDLYRSARDAGALWLLALSLVVVAPVVEETIFRGFLLPGLAASALGAWGAILATSTAWALLHAQYQPFYLVQIVVLGALFGWLRLRSGTTSLTIALHGLVNFVSLVQAALIAEWIA